MVQHATEPTKSIWRNINMSRIIRKNLKRMKKKRQILKMNFTARKFKVRIRVPRKKFVNMEKNAIENQQIIWLSFTIQIEENRVRKRTKNNLWKRSKKFEYCDSIVRAGFPVVCDVLNRRRFRWFSINFKFQTPLLFNWNSESVCSTSLYSSRATTRKRKTSEKNENRRDSKPLSKKMEAKNTLDDNEK